MSYLRTFLPWIVYAVVAGDSASSKQWGSVAGLAVAVAVIVYQVRRGSTYDALIIEMGSAAFFAGLAALALATPHSALLAYSAALANAALAAIAWGSLAIRRPFTLGIAKQTTPPEFWDQPLFIRTNVIITVVWAASFTIGAGVLAAVAHAGGGVVERSIVQVVFFVIPITFTIRYAAAVKARALSMMSG